MGIGGHKGIHASIITVFVQKSRTDIGAGDRVKSGFETIFVIFEYVAQFAHPCYSAWKSEREDTSTVLKENLYIYNLLHLLIILVQLYLVYENRSTKS